MREEDALPINILWESIKLGSKVGFILSSIYAAIGFFTLIVPTFFRIGLDIVLIQLSAVFISIYAVLPSIIIGLLTGIMIGGITKFDFTRKIPITAFSLISMVICGLTALLIHIIFEIDVIWSFEQTGISSSQDIISTYPFLFGIPTIIYILAGGWFGKTIYSRFLSS